MTFKVIESVAPGSSVRLQPGIDGFQQLGADAVEPTLRVGADVDQPSLAQDAQMLGDGRLAEVQLANQVANGPLAEAQEVQDAPSLWVGDDLERCHANEYNSLAI